MVSKQDGIEEAETTSNHLEYIWWYKADGTRTAGKLPQDPFHVTKYTDRGWTRRPPVVHEFNPDVEPESSD